MLQKISQIPAQVWESQADSAKEKFREASLQPFLDVGRKAEKVSTR